MHARERIALGRCVPSANMQEPVFRSSSHACVSRVGECSCTCIYVCNLQSLEILLVAPWKMYDALLLKASKRKFQCLDISSYSTDSALWIHPRPSSFRNTVTSSNPHPIWRVDINVNRMSVHPRERRLCTTAYQRHSGFHFGLYAIFAIEEFSFSADFHNVLILSSCYELDQVLLKKYKK